MSNYTEDTLVEQPAIALFAELGWETADCNDEIFGLLGTLCCETKSEVLLPSRLLPALRRLNSELPPETLKLAVGELDVSNLEVECTQTCHRKPDVIMNGFN